VAWGEASLGEFGCTPVALDFSLDSYSGPGWEVGELRHRSGWLTVSRAAMETPISAWSAPLVACVNDHGETISAWLAAKLFDMRCSLPRAAEDIPPVELDWVTDALYWDFLGTCDLKHLAMLEEHEADAARRVERLEARAARVMGQVERHVAGLRGMIRRGELGAEAQHSTTEHIALIERKQDEAERWLRDRIVEIRQRQETFEEDVFASLQNHGEMEQLYTVHWTTRRLRDRGGDLGRFPAWTYEQKLGIAPGEFARSVDAYRRLRWRGADTTDARRSDAPLKISFEQREADALSALTRQVVAFRKPKTPEPEMASDGPAPKARMTKREREERLRRQLAELQERRVARAPGMAVFRQVEEKPPIAVESCEAQVRARGGFAVEPAGRGMAGAATADALQFALEEQRRRNEVAARWREEDEEDRKRRAIERDAEEGL
jgi:hypothetical protein